MPARLRLATCLGAVLIGACSAFPDRAFPPSVIESIEVDYAFPPNRARTIEIPASSERLTVLELHVDPPPRGERFDGGRRFLLLPDGIEHASLRCRLQHWVTGVAHDPSRSPGRSLFPGAQAVRYHDDPLR